jgi:hypothetical protein
MFGAIGLSRRNTSGAQRRQRRRWGLCVACGISALLWIAVAQNRAAAAPNIFDDDWTPPKRTEPPVKPVQPKPDGPVKPSTLPQAQKPAPHDAGPKVVPNKGPATAKSITRVETTAPPEKQKRSPVPGKAAQSQARTLLREVFAKELSDHSPEARRLLAARFLSEADKAVDQPADAYVLLGGAYQAAKEANDLELCMRAINAMTQRFDMDAMNLKLGALSAIPTGGDPAKARAAVMAGLTLLDEAVAVDDYDAAREVSARIEQAAARAGDVSLSAYARDKAKEAKLIGLEYERIQKDLALVGSQRDARSNEAIGRFLCFIKGDWPNGLPFLAQGDDAGLRAVAEEELAAPGADQNALKVAEDWWALAEKIKGATRTAIERHAGTHYLAALGKLSGLEKLKVEKRLAEVMPFSLSVGDSYMWSAGKPSVEMIPLSQGICVLTRIGGAFYGGGEEIGIGVVGSEWRLAGRAGMDPVASATALLTPGAGTFRAPVAYTWKNGDAPVRMIRTDEGICVLSGISGGLRGEGENVRVYPGDDGYWYLGGRSGVALTVHALALRPVKANTFRALYCEAVWDAKTGPVKMISKDEGFCFISGVAGKYEGASEIARVYVDQDGFWCLDGQSRQTTMSARAISVRILPPRP